MDATAGQGDKHVHEDLMTPGEIDALKTAARDRIALLDGEISPDLQEAWDTLAAELEVLFPSERDPKTFLAFWLTSDIPALPGVPSIVIRCDGAAAIGRCKTLLRRAAHGVFS